MKRINSNISNSKIKLKNLIDFLTEQAPQPDNNGSNDIKSQDGLNAGGVNQEQNPSTNNDNLNNNVPEPENPSEYDFTRDFRTFEDKKNKAESEAKKVLLDKMNNRLLNKTIVANSSRGYGQPKTDYTIENVKKISVEFWYKDYVIIVTDQNDKKYFLTTGINIKIENGDNGNNTDIDGDSKNNIPDNNNNQNNNNNNKNNDNVVNNKEQPHTQPQELPNNQKTVVAPSQENSDEEDIDDENNPQKLSESIEDDEEDDNNYKITVPIDYVQRDTGEYFQEYLINDIKPFVKKAVTTGRDNYGTYHTKYVIEIPRKLLPNDFDIRDFSLNVKSNERHYSGAGQSYSRGYVDINPIGNNYIFTFYLSGGMDV